MLFFDTLDTTAFWQQACEAEGLDPAAPHHAGSFSAPGGGYDETFNEDLATLVRDGQKRGTTHMTLEFEHRAIPFREIGHYWVVTTTSGTPFCVVRITNVAIVPYEDVTPEFAASEGEGDLSLAFWQGAHIDYFKDQCRQWGYEWQDSQPVVCENFELIYRP